MSPSTLRDYREVIRLYGGEWFTMEDLMEATLHLQCEIYHRSRCMNAITTFKPPLERRYPKNKGNNIPQQYRERRSP